MKTSLKIFGIAFVHWVVQVVSLSVGSTLAESNFEPSFFVTLFEVLSKMLLIPVVLPVLEIWPDSLPGLVGHIPFLINSLIWGAGIYFGWKKWNQNSKSKKENVAV